MPRLIEPEPAAAWQGDLGQQTPALIAYLGASDARRGQFRHRLFDVVAHQVELVPATVFGWMQGYFGRGQREDQPAMAGVGGGKLQHVAEEPAISLRTGGVEDGVGTGYHRASLSQAAGSGTR